MKKINRLGFTLMELMVVISIIAILSALLIPAVHRAKRRAKESEIQQMCVQMVEAWKSHQVEYMRFPYKDLISWSTTTVDDIDGDLCFPMTVKAGCLLNWWKAENPFPKYDKSNFLAYIDSLGKEFDWDDPTTWPNDLVFERSGVQKQFGVVAPYLEVELNDTQASPSDRKIEEHEFMWVMLDTNGDGILSIPQNKGIPQEKTTDIYGQPIKLSAAVAAWLTSDDGTIITSW